MKAELRPNVVCKDCAVAWRDARRGCFSCGRRGRRLDSLEQGRWQSILGITQTRRAP